MLMKKTIFRLITVGELEKLSEEDQQKYWDEWLIEWEKEKEKGMITVDISPKE